MTVVVTLFTYKEERHFPWIYFQLQSAVWRNSAQCSFRFFRKAQLCRWRSQRHSVPWRKANLLRKRKCTNVSTQFLSTYFHFLLKSDQTDFFFVSPTRPALTNGAQTWRFVSQWNERVTSCRLMADWTSYLTISSITHTCASKWGMKQAFSLHLDQSFGKTLKNKSFRLSSNDRRISPILSIMKTRKARWNRLAWHSRIFQITFQLFPFDGKWGQSFRISGISRENCALWGLRGGKKGQRHASIRWC